MSKSNLERGAEFQEKFELYVISLVFTLLALSIQSAKFSGATWANGLELLGWLCLLISGVVGLWRLEYAAVILENIGKEDGIQKRITELKEAKLRGSTEVYVLQHDRFMPLDELLSNSQASLGRVQPIIKLQEKHNIAKYTVHRYSFLVALICLVVARGEAPLSDLLGLLGPLFK